MGSAEAVPGPGPGPTLRKINVKQKPSAEGTETATNAEAATPEEPVTPAGRLFMEPGMNCYILCALAFEQPIDVDEFKHTLLATLVNHKRFHSVIRKNRKGRDVWVPVPVDIDAHLTVVSPPHALHSYMTDLAAAPPLDLTRPMWHCHILNDNDNNNNIDNPSNPPGPSSHMVIRVHHALGDGTSLMSLLLACTRRLGHPEELPSVPVAKRREKKTTPTRGCCSCGVVRKAMNVVALLWNTFVGIFLFTSTALWLKDSDSVIKGKAGVEKERKKMVVEIVDMADMAVAKQAVNGTINDVLMAMVGEALLHYLEGRDASSSLAKAKGKVEEKDLGKVEEKDSGKVEEKETKAETTTSEIKAEVVKSKKISSKVEKMRIRACALMNTRGSPGLQELASMMDGGSQHRWGNHMGYLIMNIPMKHHANPLDYARAAKKITDRKKASLEGVFTYMSGAALMNLTGPVPPCILTRRVLLQTTLAISNVPGPTEPVTFAGNPIVGIYPTVSGLPQALSVYLQSYNGRASLVIMAAESAMPDPEVLGQLCMESLQGMVKAATAATMGSS